MQCQGQPNYCHWLSAVLIRLFLVLYWRSCIASALKRTEQALWLRAPLLSTVHLQSRHGLGLLNTKVTSRTVIWPAKSFELCSRAEQNQNDWKTVSMCLQMQPGQHLKGFRDADGVLHVLLQVETCSVCALYSAAVWDKCRKLLAERSLKQNGPFFA